MAIDLLKRTVIDARDFVSHTYCLDEVAKAVNTAAFDKENAIKVMVG